MTATKAGWTIGPLLAATAGGFAVAFGLPVRILLAAGLVVMSLVMPTRYLTYITVVLISLLGFIRRLTTGGRVDFDLLVVVPVALIAVLAIRGDWSGARRARGDGLALALIVLLATSHAISGSVTVSGFYFAVLAITCVGTLYLASIGVIPNVWPKVYAVAPFYGAGLALYGIYQFHVLPAWDRQWMLASGLVSIGVPVPGQVRVFGTLEGAGVFAFLLVTCLICAIFSLADHTLGIGRRLVTATVLAPIGYAIILTGVRTAILGLVVALAITAARTLSVKLWAIVTVGLAGGYVALTSLLGSFGGAGNTLLTLDRYNPMNLATDRSFAGRTATYEWASSILGNPIGFGYGTNPGGRVVLFDSTYVDVLVHGGLLALAVYVALVLVLIANVARRPPASDNPAPSWALRAVVTVVVINSVGVNQLGTTTSIFVMLVAGWLINENRQPTKGDIGTEQRTVGTTRALSAFGPR